MTQFHFTDKDGTRRVAVKCVGSPEHKACPQCGELCDLYREEETNNINYYIWCPWHGMTKLEKRK